MNRHRGETPIELGGEEYSLCFDFNALALAEEIAAKPVVEMSMGAGVSALRVLLFAGLQRYHKKTAKTVQHVGRLMDGSDFESMWETVGNALEMSMCGPPPEEIEEDEGDEDEEIPLYKGAGTGATFLEKATGTSDSSPPSSGG